MPGNGAPAGHVGANHSNLQAFLLARIHAAGMRPIVELQVVGHGVAIVHGQHQLVSGRHGNHIRAEPQPLHVQRHFGGLPGAAGGNYPGGPAGTPIDQTTERGDHQRQHRQGRRDLVGFRLLRQRERLPSLTDNPQLGTHRKRGEHQEHRQRPHGQDGQHHPQPRIFGV